MPFFDRRYPERKELLLCPRNEFGVEKFICTTVRPTQLEYTDLYDLATCAGHARTSLSLLVSASFRARKEAARLLTIGKTAFVAEHVQYEPLHDPAHLPLYVPSPTSVLAWQARAYSLLCVRACARARVCVCKYASVATRSSDALSSAAKRRYQTPCTAR